jgi:hypothetical protein
MTLPEASRYSVVITPRIPIKALRELRKLISHDFLLNDASEFNPLRGKNEKRSKIKNSSDRAISNSQDAKCTDTNAKKRNNSATQIAYFSNMGTTKKGKK